MSASLSGCKDTDILIVSQQNPQKQKGEWGEGQTWKINM